MRLLDTGYPLVVYNRTREKANPFAQRGSRVAGTTREVVEQSQIVMSVVADDPALEAVMFDMAVIPS